MFLMRDSMSPRFGILKHCTEKSQKNGVSYVRDHICAKRKWKNVWLREIIKSMERKASAVCHQSGHLDGRSLVKRGPTARKTVTEVARSIMYHNANAMLQEMIILKCRRLRMAKMGHLYP